MCTCISVFIEYFFNPSDGFSYKLCILRPMSDLELFSKIWLHLHNCFVGLYVGEIKEKLHFIFHTTASVLYGKYSTVVGKYSTMGSPEVSRI